MRIEPRTVDKFAGTIRYGLHRANFFPRATERRRGYASKTRQDFIQQEATRTTLNDYAIGMLAYPLFYCLARSMAAEEWHENKEIREEVSFANFIRFLKGIRIDMLARKQKEIT